MIGQHRAGRFLRTLTGVFVVLIAAVALAGYFYYRSQRNAVRERESQALSAIARLKATVIAAWLQERLAEGELLSGNPFLAQAARRFLQTPSGQNGDDLRAWLLSLKVRQKYADVHLLDTSGAVRLSTSQSVPELEPQTGAAVARAVREKRVVTCDLHYHGSRQVQLSVAAPLLSPPGGRAIGAMVLLIDPQQFLYPQLQTWPTPSRTAETSLVRREGDHVLYLNELRHRKNSAVSLSIPLLRRDVPAVQAVIGREDGIEGVDYRGVEVLAAARHVPNSSWFVVAKEDAAEIDNPLRERAGTAVVVAILLISAAGAALALLWRQREARFYRQCYEGEWKRRALLDAVFAAQTDAVLVCDSRGEIIRTNPAAEAYFGFDPTGMPVSEFLEKSQLAGGLHSSVTWRALQGETVIAAEQAAGDRVFESSAAPMRDSEGRTIGSVTISRDITARKRDGAALRTAYSELATIYANAPVLLLVMDDELRVEKVNDLAARFVGRNASDLLEGSVTVSSNASPNGSVHDPSCARRSLRAAVSDALRNGIRNDAVEAWLTPSTGTEQERRCFLVSAAPMDVEQRRKALVCAQDVTRLKEAEEALRGTVYELKSALAEKTVLLKEVHHRVKNNLAVISSLLALKADATASCEAKLVLEDSQRRVRSIALIHEHLYGSDRLDRINFSEYAQRLVQELYSAFVAEPKRVSVAVEADPVELGVDRAVPSALILNELLSNAFKHAFPKGREGKILVSFREAEPGCLELAVQDDGIGSPAGVDSGNAKSLGLRIVSILTRQLDGVLTHEPYAGTRIVLRFPAASADRLRQPAR
ncbi:MAG: PAS domain-containing protein [Bryobacterales bacterium]|nr:PAS domain-containing protein [Bryobacterales bacterium]